MRYEFSDDLKKIMEKPKKKDSENYKALKNKIIEIVNSDYEHYKPLKYDMKNLRSVHVKKSFVLVFEYHKSQEMIRFLDYDHHDKIYFKRYK